MKKIVVIGSCNVDFVISVPRLPREGETILANGVQTCYGGKGANQAAAVAKLGGDIAFIGCLGGDEHAPAFVSCLREYGIDTSGIEIMQNVSTGAAFINVGNAGENNIVVNPGANGYVCVELVSRHMQLMESASYCVMQMEIPLSTVYSVANVCRERGIRLIINPAPAAELDFELLRGSWMIVPNENELHTLIPDPGDTLFKATALMRKGFENVLVTLGEQGCLLVNDTVVQRYPAFHGISVTDTTAAGDSFIGALAFAISKDMDMTGAIDLASKAAAITVSRKGALTALPTWTEVLQLTEN
ncbi:MAG: ribokinase [Defluviitaleaceae bacterium]|nr:ribokinase [Defluviitaleaceae bacterium]